MARYLQRATPFVREAIELAIDGQRISTQHAIALYQEAELPLLSIAATHVRKRLNGLKAYYNRNGHIEPTNICHFNCSFCSYRQDASSPKAWYLDLPTMLQQAQLQASLGNTELHITGGVYPHWRLEDLENLTATIHQALPKLHIKAFSAIELIAIFRWSQVTMREGLTRLQKAGLASIPGGGAEIFDETIRQQLCPEKPAAHEWLALHETAHSLGIPSNATMLYGHIESYAQRADHLNRLRELQDRTHGFMSFIPLKFRAANNPLSHLGEIPLTEVLRNFAVSRLFLDNIRHLKAYWPMLGKENIPLSLSYGVDDLDGTIGNSTKIYSMAGAQDQKPQATVEELQRLITNAGYSPHERDSLYNEI